MQAGAGMVAFKDEPLNLPWKGCGGAKRRLPTGGWAYGIDWKADAAFSGHFAPCTVPASMLAVRMDACTLHMSREKVPRESDVINMIAVDYLYSNADCDS